MRFAPAAPCQAHGLPCPSRAASTWTAAFIRLPTPRWRKGLARSSFWRLSAIARVTLSQDTCMLKCLACGTRSQVKVIEPDAASRIAIGDNVLDPARKGVAVQAGLAMGQALAAELKPWWA